MKTVLLFNESSCGRKLIIKHDKLVRFSREIRNEEAYIVIRFPSNFVNMNTFTLRPNQLLSSGFKMNELENETELLFFDCLTFTWGLTKLERIGLFHVTQRHIPNEDDFYAYYIDAKGIKQWGYNALFMTLQWLMELKKKRNNQKKRI